MTRRTDKPEEADVEFVPSPILEKAMDAPAQKEGAQGQSFDSDGPVITTGKQAPDRYRVLRPWAPDTLQAKLNEAAAEGWRLAHVVNGIIILER